MYFEIADLDKCMYSNVQVLGLCFFLGFCYKGLDMN